MATSSQGKEQAQQSKQVKQSKQAQQDKSAQHSKQAQQNSQQNEQQNNQQPALDDQTLIKLAAQHFVGMVVDLRGMADVQDIAREYETMFAGAVSADDFIDLVCNQRMIGAPYALLQTDTACYALNTFLMAQYEEEHGALEAVCTEKGCTEAACITVHGDDEIPSTLASLLESQKDFEPYALEQAMLAEGSLYAWKMKQPCARALETYFNDHIPAGQDSSFTDKVMRNILQMTTGGYKATELIDYLASEGFVVEEKEAVDLLTNVLSAMPRWDTNGWSADGLMYKEYGYTISAAPNAGKHVGRNDPCPCGSGKKYKKCCGRYV